ncbi:MAG: terminase small subunit [Stellaceae bacterium]
MHIRIQQFVREYLIDLNAAAAARRCGYPASAATTRGNKLMARQDVQAAVKEAMAVRAVRTGVTSDRVVLEYARIAFADARDYYDWGPWGMKLRPANALDADAAAAVSVVAVSRNKQGDVHRLRLHDKHRALNMLARHLGLSTERRRTYSLSPDDKLGDRAAFARVAREARAILLDTLDAKDEEFDRLAHEIAQAWREVVGGNVVGTLAKGQQRT